MALAIAAVQASAAPLTSEAAFLAQVGAGAGHLSFDNLQSGTDLSGATLGFTNDARVRLTLPSAITDEFGRAMGFQVLGTDSPARSSPNSLGTDDAANFGQITAGTRFSLQFTSQVTAFGLSFITPDEVLDDDIQLLAGADRVALSVSDRTLIRRIGGVDYYAYFLGVVSPSGFDIASIDYGAAVSGGPFLYTIDDIRVAGAAGVPEPGSMGLAALALMGAGLASGYRRKAGERPAPPGPGRPRGWLEDQGP